MKVHVYLLLLACGAVENAMCTIETKDETTSEAAQRRMSFSGAHSMIVLAIIELRSWLEMPGPMNSVTSDLVQQRTWGKYEAHRSRSHR